MAKNQKFVAMEKAALVKEIQNIGKVGMRLNTRIQVAAMNALYYSIQENYVQYGQNLLMSLTAGHRKNSLVAFFEKHGNFQWSKENKSLGYRKNDKVSLDTLDEIREGWWEAIKEPEIKSSIDFEDDAKRFIKRMEKAMTDKLNIANRGLYDYMAEAYAKFHADKAELLEVEEEAELSDEEQTELAELMQIAVQGDARQELRAA